MATLLIIDDDAAIRGLWRSLFESRGYTVHEASTGRQGALVVEAHAVDVIILDLFMPECDGLEFLKMLKKRGSREKVVAVSNGGRYGLTNMLDVAAATGACATIQKSCEPEDLARCVESLLEGGQEQLAQLR